MRWALYEAAQVARRPRSPDRAYYEQAAERLGGNRACLALARKLLKRCYHTLRELGDDALAPPVEQTRSGAGSAAARRASSGSPSTTKPAATREQRRCSGRLTRASAALCGNECRPGRNYQHTTFQPFARVKPSLTPMRRGRLPEPCCRHATRVDGLERSSGRNASPSGITPSNISSPAHHNPRAADRSKPGRPRAKLPATNTPTDRPALTMAALDNPTAG